MGDRRAPGLEATGRALQETPLEYRSRSRKGPVNLRPLSMMPPRREGRASPAEFIRRGDACPSSCRFADRAPRSEGGAVQWLRPVRRRHRRGDPHAADATGLRPARRAEPRQRGRRADHRRGLSRRGGRPMDRCADHPSLLGTVPAGAERRFDRPAGEVPRVIRRRHLRPADPCAGDRPDRPRGPRRRRSDASDPQRHHGLADARRGPRRRRISLHLLIAPGGPGSAPGGGRPYGVRGQALRRLRPAAGGAARPADRTARAAGAVVLLRRGCPATTGSCGS